VAAAADHLDQYRAAHRGDPAWAADVAEAAEHLGLARRLQGRPADAVGYYREAVALYAAQAVVPRDRLTAARLGLAGALDEAGEHAAAVAELRAAADADPAALYPLALRLLVPPSPEPVGEVAALLPAIPDAAERAEAAALARLRAGDPAGALAALDRGPPGAADRPVGGCVRVLAGRATGRSVRNPENTSGGRAPGAVVRLRAEVRAVAP
jgi:tetratricopeptide (TPR) repeat protein